MPKGKRNARDRRTEVHLRLADAHKVVGMLRVMGEPVPGDSGDKLDGLAAIAITMREWRKHGSVVIEVDNDFADALANTDPDTPVGVDWVDRLPFPYLVVALRQPLSLPTGEPPLALSRSATAARGQYTHWHGFAACGVRVSHIPTGLFTEYVPFDGADGAMVVWVGESEQTLRLRSHLTRLPLRGEWGTTDRGVTIAPDPDGTLREFLDRMAGEPGQADAAQASERVLVNLAVQTLMYLSAREPDLERVAPPHRPRSNPAEKAEFFHLGWRMGAALRAVSEPARPAGGDVPEPGGTGRRLPAHMRRAHWHRVRIATRDDTGRIIGSRTGAQGVDWFYELRWFPPAAVNADDQHQPPPTVRPLAT